MASNAGDGVNSLDNSTCIDEGTETESKAAFAVYRPEIRGIADPLTYREAIRKYKKQAVPMYMEDHARNFKKRLVARAHRKNVSNPHAVNSY